MRELKGGNQELQRTQFKKSLASVTNVIGCLNIDKEARKILQTDTGQEPGRGERR